MIRHKLLMKLTEKLPARAIDLDGKYYIERYHVVKVGSLHILLHRYLSADGDREVHDHPWKRAIGIPLTGGYTEERVIGFCQREGWISKFVKIRPWWWNSIGPMRFHKIYSVLPGTWTLFITWKRFKTWSFASRPITMPGIVLQQQYDTESTLGWEKSAELGKQFRIKRGTDK